MEEVKTYRTKEEINNDYNMLCAMIGDRIIKAGMVEMIAKFIEINNEANALPKEEPVEEIKQ